MERVTREKAAESSRLRRERETIAASQGVAERRGKKKYETEGKCTWMREVAVPGLGDGELSNYACFHAIRNWGGN